MQLDIDLTQWLQWTTNNTIPVEQNKIAEDYTTSPAIMFVRRNANQDLFLDGSLMNHETEYDVEVYGTDVDAVDAIVELIRPLLNGFRGEMGETTILAAFVADHADEYTPKIEMSTDEGLHVQTLSFRVLHI